MNAIRIYKIVVVAVLLGMASICPGAGDTWTQIAPMPTARALLSTSAVDGKIYAIGGRRNNGDSASSAVEQYDPATDTWTTKAPMPTARQWLSTSAVNGKIYAFGGSPRTYQTALSTVEEYDPATDTWTEKAPMPTTRLTHSTSVVDGKIYVIGGAHRPGVWTEELVTSDVEEYDPATDTWTTKAPMPTARAFVATSVVNGKIYAFGGATAAGGTVLSTVEEYDPATDTWTTKAPMPTRRAVSSASTVNGIIYVIGGGRSGTGFSTVEAYDPATDTWTEKAPMPTARLMHSSSVVDGKIYAIGGSPSSPYNGISTVEEYEIRFIPADFNRDGIVDIKDLLILIENWGQNEPLVDIAPLPFGDGIVDFQDLEVLMSYWGQKVEDLIAHWALDETEGDIAYDSVAVNDAVVFGDAVWQPDGGQVNGALAFDGTDDYVSTPFILDPAVGAFSVFAWIKGGAPGQVILTQIGGADWLSADPLEGKLITDLSKPAGDRVPPQPLLSEFVITDGDWHRIGFVWDGSNRILYVDDVEVGRDTQAQASLEGVYGGLYLGASSTLDAASFFSGLIDDVRIYDRAITP
ncbi:MAG: kelch repeat-containing protein [Planctomycetota bacterium]|jgi:N-acetylneuraminic acid mutarotase